MRGCRILRRFSLTGRLLLAMFLILAVPVGALGGLGWYLRRTVRADVEQKVDTTLALAMNMEESLLSDGLTGMAGVAEAAAGDPAVVAAVAGTASGAAPGPADGAAGGDAGEALRRLVRAFPRADVLTVVDGQGAVRLRATSATTGEKLALGGLVQRAVTTGEMQASPGLIGPDELAGEGGPVRTLVDMAIARKANDPRSGGRVDTALALLAVAPVRGADGRILGAVVAADILNKDYRIVDEVARRSADGIPITATIALDGIRVSTNVRLSDPETGQTDLRALGTFYSDQVMQALRQNREYRGRAEVVGQWQRTIYRPVTDYQGQVIAGAYVGIPEEYFTTVDRRLTRSGSLVILLGSLALLLALVGAVWMVRLGLREWKRAVGERLAAAAEQLDGLGRKLCGADAATDGAYQRALAAAEGSAEAAAELTQGAGQTLSRLHQLADAMKAAGEGVRRQERSVLYIGHVANEIAGGLKESQQHAAAALDDVARLTAGARAALQEAAEFTAGLTLLRRQMEAGEPLRVLDLLKDPAEVLVGVATQAERVAEAVRSLVMVLQENQARLAFIHEEMGRVGKVVQATTARTQQAGDAAGTVIGWMEGMTGTVAAMADEVLAARIYLEGVAEANARLQDLCAGIEARAAEFRRAAAELSARPKG